MIARGVYLNVILTTEKAIDMAQDTSKEVTLWLLPEECPAEDPADEEIEVELLVYYGYHVDRRLGKIMMHCSSDHEDFQRPEATWEEEILDLRHFKAARITIED